MLILMCFHDISATKKNKTSHRKNSHEKTLHHGNNPVCFPKYFISLQKQFDATPNNLNRPGKFYCHLSKYLNHPGLQVQQSQLNHSEKKLPTLPENF